MTNWNDAESITGLINKLSDSIHRFKVQVSTDSNYHAVQDDSYAKEIGNNVDCVQIYAPDSLGIHAILHEMGHFIGKRSRIKRVRVLAEIVLCCYMNEILCVIIAKLSDSPNVNHSQIYRPLSPKTGNRIVDRILKKMRPPRGERSDRGTEEIWNYYMPTLIEIYKALWAKIQPLINDIMEYAAPSKNTVGQDQKEKEFFAFSDMVIPMVSSVLYDELQKCDVLIPLRITGKRRSIINSAVKAVLDSCDCKLPLLMADYQKCIGEPTADCFMLAVSGMDYSEYIRLVMKAEWEEWKERRMVDRSMTPSFVEFVSNPVFIARILSIGYAMEDSIANMKKCGLNWNIKRGISRLLKYERGFRDGDAARIEMTPKTDRYYKQNIRFPIAPISLYIKDCYEQNLQYYSDDYPQKDDEWLKRMKAANEIRERFGRPKIKINK